MQFKIDPRIFKEFPEVRIGVVAAYNINNTKTQQEIIDLLHKQQEAIRLHLVVTDLPEHPYIASWREAYRQFGAKPKEHYSSIENLIRRTLDGQVFRSINPLVDIYHSVSLKYMLPVGGEDLDTIKGDIVLTFAGINEKPVVLLGEKEARTPNPGEVIYKDDEGTICRRWNWKEADRTKITANTHNAILVLEALSPVDTALLKTATYELARLIGYYCGGSTSVAFLDAQNKSIVLKRGSEYVNLEPVQEEVVEVISPLELIKKQKTAHEISGEYKIRTEKVKRLRAMGIEPWPSVEPVQNTAQQVVDDFKDDSIKRLYTIAGRVMVIRLHGKAAFADIQDRTGRVQIYLKANDVGQEVFNFFKEFIDPGDIIWCTGYSFKTKTGEISLHVEQFKLLSKSLHPLPEKFHGLTHIETKYRQRYLDLMTNPETRQRFLTRTAIIKDIRCYLDKHGFIEVETPMLHPIPGGAAARPFITHHNALNTDFYLRIAPELYLKRLVVGGFERVYEINRNFRNEGVSTRHNPEFTMVEFYMAHQDYIFAMDFVEQLLRSIVQHVHGKLLITFGEHTIDFSKPFERMSAQQAIVKYSVLTEKDLAPSVIATTCAKYGVKLLADMSYNEQLFALFEEVAEDKLIQPTYIIDFPIEISPLAKRDQKNPAIAARFELFIVGMEIANGFNELNDPFDQAERFMAQVKARDAGDEEAMRFDADYITALEYGLPPTVGVGIGIDRLVMVLTNTTSIKEVILFPALKKKEAEAE